MISKEQLLRIAQQTGLALYQQEKDYLLKLFLYFYYKKFGEAVFKGGTCLKYLLGIPRFSEDLDFNIPKPRIFEEQVKQVLADWSTIGLKSYFVKNELFADAYTCEIGVEGPLFLGTAQTRNKFRIDAGYRTGTFLKPEWRLIKSEYPETENQFLVQSMALPEMLVEKVMALSSRRKGRDLYDLWFIKNAGVLLDKRLLQKKLRREKKKMTLIIPTKQEYERDISRLALKVIPYEQVKKEVEGLLQAKKE
ncbi:nucleotidyl transferase AbiEii/AbiGii toxin family protein [Candidatus Woesearchaeota archaeon]|nr:nucleotidyl transferase AbiEii/AbiGii toxin family protein [Candidatus Woesearchaeota archaeon]